ncbi:hypothetical protein [Actinoplanes philippinensis]|uniref:hypothetical protein n=1 Tax=Actinoplanes philippinensis TaxID=35752 RepID=UPI0033C78882
MPVERRHLGALGVAVSPEEMHGTKGMEDAFADFSCACTARTVPAEMSVDIVGGVHRRSATVEGVGILARPPRTPPARLPPGAYQI